MGPLFALLKIRGIYMLMIKSNNSKQQVLDQALKKLTEDLHLKLVAFDALLNLESMRQKWSFSCLTNNHA